LVYRVAVRAAIIAACTEEQGQGKTARQKKRFFHKKPLFLHKDKHYFKREGYTPFKTR
jgi:hypothetical protein